MNLVKAIGFGTLSLLVGLGGWKLFTNANSKASVPTKEETLQILETLRQEFYPILIKIADLVEKQLAPKGMTPEQNQSYVLKDPTIKSEIERINQKAYANFSEDQVRQATQKIYKEDGDIIKQKKQFTQQYKRSLLGVKPDPKMVISRKLDKHRVLETISEILEDKIARFQTQNNESMSEGEIRAFLDKDVEEDQRVTKQKVKENLGLCAKDSIKIFHFIVQQYKKSDESFLGKYAQILEKYNLRIKKLIRF